MLRSYKIKQVRRTERVAGARWFVILDAVTRNSLLRREHGSKDQRERNKVVDENGGVDQEKSSRGSEERADSFSRKR